MGKAIRLLQEGLVKHIPSARFDFSQFTAAARFAGQKHQRAVLLCDPERTVVPIQSPPAAPLTFNPRATYLLIGCLGGLGRRLT